MATVGPCDEEIIDVGELYLDAETEVRFPSSPLCFGNFLQASVPAEFMLWLTHVPSYACQAFFSLL